MAIIYKFNNKNKKQPYSDTFLSEVKLDKVTSFLQAENPYLPELGSRKAFKIDERGYEWHPYGEVFKILGSKMYAYHGGHYSGISHARTHALQLGCNVVYGHTHDSQMAYSLGCLTDMTKSYLKGRPTNWSHNVAILDIFTNNNFNLVVLDIVNGVTSYGGDIISA